jgi:dTDP-glucose 4,6-dehydratase
LEVIKKLLTLNNINNIEDYIDFTYSRPGQDVRYALDDSKLRSLGWKPKAEFNTELQYIVNYYKNKFIW